VNIETAIVEYSPTAAALADLSRRMSKVVYDVSTPKGLAAAKADRAEVRDLRVALEKKRVEIKAPALKRCKEIDTEAARITAELLKFETPPDDAIKAEERRIEAERQAKIAAEEKLMRELQERIAKLRGNQNLTPMSGSKLLAEHISDLQALPVDESFGDMLPIATAAKAEGLARLNGLLETALANEKESARLLAERAELDRQRAEQAERDRVAREAREAEEAAARKARDEEARRENERLAKERAAFEAEQAEVRRKQAAENARIASEQAAAQKVIDDARRELETRQQAEREAAAKKERERIAAEQEAARLAEEQKRKSFRPEFEAIVHVLCTTYGVDAATVRTWIAEIPASNSR
jgi:colicin import membrane protein